MAKKNKDLIIANMATIPTRVAALRDCVASLLPQVDGLHISLNGVWDNIPDFLNNAKITLYISADIWGVDNDPGDVAKFYNVRFQKGYIFTVDDKFIYPTDYTQYLIKAIEDKNREAVVSLHGRNFHTNRKMTSYYYDSKDFFGCLNDVDITQYVHELGTGMMAWHSDTVKWPSKITTVFPRRNMTDVYASVFFNENSIPRVIVAHNQGYIRISPKHNDKAFSISMNTSSRDQIVTEVVNSINWKL